LDLPVLATPPVTLNVALSTRVLRILSAMGCQQTQHATRVLHVPVDAAREASVQQIAQFVAELTYLRLVRRGALAVPNAA